MKQPALHSATDNCRRIATAAAACGVLAAAWFGNIAPASAQVMVLAPPAPVYEAAPAPRVGYAWERGYWAWQYGRYVWVPGHWTGVERRVVVAPPAPPVAQVMRVSADALFAFDRGDLADILPGGRADIRDIAAKLSASRFARIEVRGYTDRLGSASYNLQLSQRRANAVKALLVQHGIPADRIDARGLGEQDPITHCSDNQSHDGLVACLQPDRRVEIVTFARTDDRYGPPQRPYQPYQSYQQ
ncbi:OmpA family protein [Burkholderia anthina]|uniref:OmpA family protein n=1 Tax=Burkholderia anthina TaxID=179879 RepID=UPI0037C0B9BD